jgi:hypothetical protein
MPPKKPSPARELFEVIVGALDRAEAELSPPLYERLLEKVGLRVDARLEDLLGDDEDDGEEDDLADEEEEDA